MPIFIFFVVLVLIFNFIPGLYKAIEFLFIGPFLGLIFGGFIWAILALIVPALLCGPAFAIFIIFGVVGAWKWLFS